MAVMADFSRLPTQRKVLVFVVIGALLGGLYFQFVFKGLKQDVEDAEGDHAGKLTKNTALEADIPKYEALKARYNVLRRIIDENQKALPTESDLPAFFENLNRKVTEAGVEVEKWRQISEVQVESFVKVPVEIELTGTFMQIKKFFASLVPKKKRPGQDVAPNATGDQVEERERIVSIENLSLTQPTAKNREWILKARFTAATYRQEDRSADDAEPPPGKPGAPKKPGATPKKPSTAPTKPAAKPLPPADTPAGAKARAEKAMEKDESRTRNAPEVQEPAGSGRLKGGL